MANAVNLGTWILENLRDENLELSEYSWPKLVGLELYDFQSKYRIGNDTYIGRGTSSKANEAINKAVIESIERLVVHKLELETSSGTALHLEQHKACRNALNEALERDQFLCYFYTNTPFSAYVMPDSMLINTICNLTKTKNWETKFYLLNNCNGLFTTMCAIQNEGIYIGLSTSSDIHFAFEHSCIEAFRSWVHDRYFNNEELKVSVSIVDLEARKKPRMHGDYYTEARNFEKIRHLFNSPNSKIVVNDYPSLETNEIQIRDFNSSLPLNVHGAVAEVKNLQALFFGMPSETNINIERMRKFKNRKNFEFENILYEPHPLR